MFLLLVLKKVIVCLNKPFTKIDKKTAKISCLSLLYAGAYFLAMNRRQAWGNVGDLVYLVLFGATHFFAVYACVRHALKIGKTFSLHRNAWLFFGGASLTYTLGNLCYVALLPPHGTKVSFPSLADFWWLAYAPCFVVGVALLSDRITGVGRVRLLLDSAITTGSIGALVWYFLIRGQWQQSGISLFARCVSVAYPVGDTFALFVALYLLGGLALVRTRRPGMTPLAMGILCWTFSDFCYCFLVLHSNYNYGNFTDCGFMLGGLLIGVSAKLQPVSMDCAPLVATQEPLPLKSFSTGARFAFPYLALVASIGIILFQERNGTGVISEGVLYVCLSLMLLVMLRQVFTLWENRRLSQTVVALNEKLEKRVQQRTGQLEGLLDLTRALANVASIQEVIEAALTHTKTSFEACATVLWLCAPSDPDAPTFCHHRGLEQNPDLVRLLSQVALGREEEWFSLPFEGESCLRIPLLWHGERLGMIGIIQSSATSKDAGDSTMLGSMASEVGCALSNVYRNQVELETADRDAVTGLFNHRAIQQRLEIAFETAGHAGVPVTLMMFDLENFRLFNDTYGHERGDLILRCIGEAILEILPTDTYVGRYGGDEFLAVLLGISTEEAKEYAQKLQTRTASMGFHQENDDRVIPVSVACGISSFPQDCKSRHDLISLADSNLCEAKQQGEAVCSSSPMHFILQELRADPEFETLDAMVTAVDNKDAYTRRHSEDVTQFALWIAEELFVSEGAILRSIRVGGLLHDVGKIGVPANILCKPGRLTGEEYDTLKRHPRLGALIVGSVPGMESVLDAVRSHHERWDGKGYPDATAGKATPWLGRLMAVADAFSAMTTDRPYRKGLEIASAILEIEKGAGTQFDPEMARAFLCAARKHYPSVVFPEYEIEERVLKAA